MGFTAIATTAAATLPKVLQSYTSYQQGKALNKTARLQEKQANQQADAIQDTAAANQARAARNAHERMSSVRADAASSGLASEGSVAVRERDMATRLQDEITAAANEELNRADTVRRQGAMAAWQTRQAAAQSKARAIGHGVSAMGSLFSGIAKGLEE